MASKGKPSPKRTARQGVFVDMYMGPAKCNATLAAEMAGYKNANKAGAELTNPRLYPAVAAEISRRRAELREESELTAKELMAALATVIRYNPKDLLGPDGKPRTLAQMPERTAAALSVGYRMKTRKVRTKQADGTVLETEEPVVELDGREYNKLEAIALAAKILGLTKGEGVQNTVVVQQVDWGAMLRQLGGDGPGAADDADEVEADVERILTGGKLPPRAVE